MNEQYRQSILAQYRIMDTAGEAVFDNLVQLTAKILDAPICLVSLVDDHRQWFKAKHGLEAEETPREDAFCAHAIQTDEVFVVEDASLHELFKDNPLVTGGPNIRFYAGAPLTVESGARLGSLCIIDSKPRNISKEQREMLETMRDALVAHLEYRKAAQDLKLLRSVIPMCAWCNKIGAENDDGAVHWMEFEDYVRDRGNVTHGVCPDCASKVQAE